MSKIGICTITYNQRHCAPDVVSNLRELEGDDCAFFVRDDCSTDGTFEYFQAAKIRNLHLQGNEKRLGSRKNSIELYSSVDTEYMVCKGGDGASLLARRARSAPPFRLTDQSSK